MADGRHLGFRFWAIISASINIFCAKFSTVMENQQPKGSQCSKIRFSKIQDGDRPPSWISILGQRLRVFSVRSIAGSSIHYTVDDEWPQKEAWPRWLDLLLKQWDRYPRSTERISCWILIFHVATDLRCGGIFNDSFIESFLLSLNVKKLKIGQYLAKLWTRV